MKMKKYLMIICLCFGMLAVLTGCGSESESGTTTEETGTEEVTTEEVTEFDNEEETLSFSELENGLNFKASGTSVTLKFEEIDEFDNSLKMELSLSDAAYEKDPVTILISGDQDEYQFEDLEAGEEYYLEVYPTESADSDDEYETIQEKNSDCQLQLIQSE